MDLELNASTTAISSDQLNQPHPNFQHPQQQVPNFRELVLSSYLITFSLGIVGNSLVIFVIAYYGEVRRKSVANYYILNLAAADLAFVFSLPFFSYATATKHWPFGSVACKLLTTTREINRYASVYTLVALSVDRLLASFYYCARWRTPFKGKVICVVIWAVSLAISLPYVIFSDVAPQSPSSTTPSCRTTWPTKNEVTIGRIIAYLDFVVAFAVPVVAIFISYSVLAYRTRRMDNKHATIRTRAGRHNQQSRKQQYQQQLLLQEQKRQQQAVAVVVCINGSTTPQQVPQQQQQQQKYTRARRRPSVQMTRTVLAIVLIFIVCHTPHSSMQLVSQKQRERVDEARRAGLPLQPNFSELIIFAYVNMLALILLFLNSCVNPIIYGLSNRNFRQLYLDAIRKCCSVICRTRHRPSFDRHQGATTHGRSSSNGPMHQRNKFQLEMATLDQAVKECSTAFDPVTNIATPNVDYLALPGCGSPNLLSTSSLGSRLFLSGDECTSNFGSCSPPPITRATTIISSPAVTPQ